MTNLTEEDKKLLINFVELMAVMSSVPGAINVCAYSLNEMAGVLAERLGEVLCFTSVGPLAVEYYRRKGDPISKIKADVWEILMTTPDYKFNEDLWNSAFED